MLNIPLSKDLCSGILFLLVGLGGLWWGGELDFGSAAEMGPGFMPVVLGWLIIGFGLITIARSFWVESGLVGRLRLRPLLLISLSVVVFGILAERVGFVLASFAAVLLTTLAAERPNPAYVLGMAIILPVASTIVFVYGLGLPFDLWWD